MLSSRVATQQILFPLLIPNWFAKFVFGTSLVIVGLVCFVIGKKKSPPVGKARSGGGGGVLCGTIATKHQLQMVERSGFEDAPHRHLEDKVIRLGSWSVRRSCLEPR